MPIVTPTDDGDCVVSLRGVPAALAYAMGMEAGVFIRDAANGEGEGTFLFHAANIGMIEMICVEEGLTLDVVSSSDDWLECHVYKPKRVVHVIKGGKD
jgi:hypothetical protein